MRVLFWNTHNNENINPILSEMIIENNASIVVLAEYAADSSDLVNRISALGKHMFWYLTTGCDRIVILGSVDDVESGRQTPHTSTQIINGKDILCGVHLPSQAYPDHEERSKITINRLITDIRSLEEELGTENTIIVGDFNINPYDNSCVGAPYLHSLPIYADTARKKRTVAGEEFYMFYNPMWNLFGDFESPHGTYYYGGSSTNNTFWNIYDQVIIRPGLRKRFVDDSLQIITKIKMVSLLDENGHPDSQFSDHLPIVFEIRED